VTEVHRSHLGQLVVINAIWGFNIVAVKLSVDRSGTTGWGALLYSALLASLVTHTAYFALIRRYPVSSVAPVTG
jgi:drug/metabolite transporter (DMT)-like permease